MSYTDKRFGALYFFRDEEIHEDFEDRVLYVFSRYCGESVRQNCSLHLAEFCKNTYGTTPLEEGLIPKPNLRRNVYPLSGRSLLSIMDRTIRAGNIEEISNIISKKVDAYILFISASDHLYISGISYGGKTVAYYSWPENRVNIVSAFDVLQNYADKWIRLHDEMEGEDFFDILDENMTLALRIGIANPYI